MNIDIEKSWYTKHRPTTMEEYSGERMKMIVSKRFTSRINMPHVVMIHGPRGCGKTTACRILSKYCVCLNPKENGEPCEECEMCQSVNEILISGESSLMECPGVTEVDATTANGKEAIGNIMEDAIQAPIFGDFKVVIFDECHMITAAAQNSLLKLIEDIPSHLIVIFATTDINKVLQTVKSRCQLTLEVKKQDIKDMVYRLMQISKIEGLTVSEEALKLISKKGNRVPRECINLLEDVAKTYDRKITVENVMDRLGGVNSDIYMEYFKAANKGLGDVLEFIQMFKESNIKFVDFVSGLVSFVMDSMYIKHGISLEDYNSDYIKIVKELFEMYNTSDFDVLLQVLEYLAAQDIYDESSKADLLLTTTAMRISKIDMMANGLEMEQSEAFIENKTSLYEHSKRLKANNEKAIERAKIDFGIEEMREEFKEIKVVQDSCGIFDDVVIPEIVYEDDIKDEVEWEDTDKEELGDKLDEFLSHM